MCKCAWDLLSVWLLRKWGKWGESWMRGVKLVILVWFLFVTKSIPFWVLSIWSLCLVLVSDASVWLLRKMRVKDSGRLGFHGFCYFRFLLDIMKSVLSVVLIGWYPRISLFQRVRRNGRKWNFEFNGSFWFLYFLNFPSS